MTETQGQLLNKHLKWSTNIAAEALDKCLTEIGCTPLRYRLFVLCDQHRVADPGISARLMKHLDMRQDCSRLDVVGMGCNAGLNGLAPVSSKHWLVHSGGKKVIDSLRVNLGLSRRDVRHTLSVLCDYGNLSSASFLFSFERLHQENVVEPGDYGVITTTARSGRAPHCSGWSSWLGRHKPGGSQSSASRCTPMLRASAVWSMSSLTTRTRRWRNYGRQWVRWRTTTPIPQNGLNRQEAFDRFSLIVNGPALFNAIVTAFDLGIFPALEATPGVDLPQLAERTGIPAEKLRVLMFALCSTGLVCPSEGGYANAELASELLAHDGPDSWSHILKGWQRLYYPAFSHLTESLQQDRNSALDHYPGEEETLYARLQHSLDLQAVLHRAMSAFILQSLPGLADNTDLAGIRHLLDVGGGDGTTALALVRHWPALSITTLDMPSVRRTGSMRRAWRYISPYWPQVMA